MENVFLHLLNMSLSAAVLVMVVVLLRLVFSQAPRWIHCLLWALVAVRLLCPFTLESSLSLMPDTEAALSVLTEQFSAEQQEVPDAPTGNPPVIETPVPDAPVGDTPVMDAPVIDTPVIDTPVTIPTPDAAVSTVAPEASVDPWQIVLTVAAYVWLVGMFAMALYAAVTTLRLRHRVSEAARLTNGVWCCDHIRTPFILGVFRPRIYLPSDLSGTARDSVLAHEQAHLHRRDHWWKPLGFILLTVYWFNPLMWVAYVLLCRDIEAACDERVVRDMTAPDRKAYSEALLLCSAPRRLISACPLAFGETSVKSRIKSVLSYKKPTVWIIVAALLVSTVAGVCLLTDRPAAESESGDPPSVSDGDGDGNPTADPESNELPSVNDGDDRPTGDGAVVSTGEPLYDALLKTMVDARQQRPDCSAMVWQLAEWSDLGVRLLDVDQNGQKELLLSAVQWVEGVTPFAYDVYTIKDDKLVHLLSSVERGRYYLREDGYVEYQWAGGASVSGTDFYRLVDGSLTFVERVTYDADYAVEIGLADGLSSVTEGFWFRTTHIPDGSKEGYVSITPQQAKDRIAAITSAHPLLNVAYSPAMSGSTTTTSPTNTTTVPSTSATTTTNKTTAPTTNSSVSGVAAPSTDIATCVDGDYYYFVPRYQSNLYRRNLTMEDLSAPGALEKGMDFGDRSDLRVSDGRVYYIESGCLYSCRFDGTDTLLVDGDETLLSYDIAGDWIFSVKKTAVNVIQQEILCVYRKDGSQRKVLTVGKNYAHSYVTVYGFNRGKCYYYWEVSMYTGPDVPSSSNDLTYDTDFGYYTVDYRQSNLEAVTWKMKMPMGWHEALKEQSLHNDYFSASVYGQYKFYNVLTNKVVEASGGVGRRLKDYTVRIQNKYSLVSPHVEVATPYLEFTDYTGKSISVDLPVSLAATYDGAILCTEQNQLGNMACVFQYSEKTGDCRMILVGVDQSYLVLYTESRETE